MPFAAFRRTYRTITIFVTVLCLSLVFSTAASANHIRASLIAERPVAPGDTVMLAVLMQPEQGWHGYWINPGDAGLPLTLEWTVPTGGTMGQLEFPVPQTLLISGLMNHVYEHDYAVLVPFTVPKSAKIGTTLPLSAKAQWLACTEQICVPERAQLEGTVTIGRGAGGSGRGNDSIRADPRFAGWSASLPAPLDRPGTFALTDKGVRLAIPFPASARIDAPHFFIAGEGVADYAAPQRFFRQGDTLVVELAKTKVPSAEQPTLLSGVLSLGGDAGGIALTAKAGPVPAGGTPVGPATATFSGATLALAILGAVLGGLVLNVMPCVFPILSLKALALARGNSHDAHVEGLAYTAGVILACLALGGAMLGLRAAGEEIGWAFQLQEPGIVALLLLLSVAITANFAGLYEIPGLSFERGAGRKSGAAGAFGTGLLAAFVATPCTGPFMATAMGAALVLPWWAALCVFAGLGLGLGLPFLALGFIPPLRKLLPKPGKWMETFRRAMAVPMGFTVLALGWLAWRLGGPVFTAAALALAAVMLVLLAQAGSRQRSGTTAARWALPAGLALAALAVIGLPRLANATSEAESSLLDQKPFSEAALADARKGGKPVFVYFTADWCLSCKVNESVAIERETTRDAFVKAGVTVLKGDWTRRDAAITRFLTAQGAAGVPLYLWYPAGASAPAQLPQVLGPDTLPTLATKG